MAVSEEQVFTELETAEIQPNEATTNDEISRDGTEKKLLDAPAEHDEKEQKLTQNEIKQLKQQLQRQTTDETRKEAEPEIFDEFGRRRKSTPNAQKRSIMTDAIKTLAQICEDQEGLDIYQICAFSHWAHQKQHRWWKWRIPPTDSNDRAEDYSDEQVMWEERYYFPKMTDYFSYGFKAFVTCFLQIAGLIILFYRVITDGTSQRDWCENNGAIDGKTIVCAFSYYVGFTVGSWMENIAKSGMYKFFDLLQADSGDREDNCPFCRRVCGGVACLASEKSIRYSLLCLCRKSYEFVMYNNVWNDWNNLPFFVNSTWLQIGFYANNIALVLALLLSYFIIFFSETPFDVILNSVAVFFMLEIDDLLVQPWEYEIIEQMIYYLRVSEDEDNKELSIPEQFIEDDSNKHPCFCLKILFGFVEIALKVFMALFPLIMYTLPILMAVCY